MLLALVFSVLAFAADSNPARCWIFSAILASPENAAASTTDKKDSLEKTIDLSRSGAQTLLNEDDKHSYSASFQDGMLTFLSLRDKSSDFLASAAPQKALTDKESVVLALRKPSPAGKKQLVELHCAKEAFFKKWKATNR